MNERAGGEGAAGDDEGGAPGLVGKGRRGAKARCPRAAHTIAKMIENTAIKPQVAINPNRCPSSRPSVIMILGYVIAAMNWKNARIRPPSAASSNPGRWNVWRLRSAVMRSPHPVALSTAAGVRELDGCAFRRAVIAKKAASRMTTSSAITSKPLVSLYSEAAGVEGVGCTAAVFSRSIWPA